MMGLLDFAGVVVAGAYASRSASVVLTPGIPGEPGAYSRGRAMRFMRRMSCVAGINGTARWYADQAASLSARFDGEVSMNDKPTQTRDILRGARRAREVPANADEASASPSFREHVDMRPPSHDRAPYPAQHAHDADAGKPASAHDGLHKIARRLQLGSGIMLWIYISVHMVNHALGIWSVDVAERGLHLAIGVWQSLPGTILLYGAAGLHFALALRTVYGRRHWALPPAEWLRLWAGLGLPLLLIRHVVGTRVATSFYGFEPNYARVVVALLTSGTQGLQIALLAPGWVHGSLGLWFHLRRRAFFRRARFVLLGVLVLLPVLSAAGFLQMTRAVVPGSLAVAAPDATLVAHRAALDSWRHLLVTGYLSLIVAAFAGGQWRNRFAGGVSRGAPREQ
ncbi:hypothetical protein [Burkholderia sp. PR2]|uniref:hypothetical protein n=1 Tax=Burkholderia sp. PR2 TaxID=3448078 RepID=UPI00402A9644